MSSEAHIPHSSAVLTTTEMYLADEAAARSGIPTLNLMEAAGAHVAREIRQRWRPRRTAILCGPGNNGGDGFVIARLLKNAGWPVRLGMLSNSGNLAGDAAINAARWKRDGGRIEQLPSDLVNWCHLAVDAMFGAGLSRPLNGVSREVVSAIVESERPCVAIDVPSGVSGDTGALVGGDEGIAPQCDLTVTFFRPKPGHFIQPGRNLCGDVALVDIGIPPEVLDGIRPQTALNGPALWSIPSPGPFDHKYTRGHAVVFGGALLNGAARLAAAAARRVGAGLVTAVAPEHVTIKYTDGMPGLIFRALAETDPLDIVLDDPRSNAVLIGPGHGVGLETKKRVLEVLAAGKMTVLDADALTSFAGVDAVTLFEAIESCTGQVVITPHEGEFSRLFGVYEGFDRLSLVRKAASTSGATVLLKGSDTVIAAPDGRAALSAGGPAWLATGGSGDVLAGLIVGLMAQGLQGWKAACAGDWLHSAAAREVGPGLIAEDLISALPSVRP